MLTGPAVIEISMTVISSRQTLSGLKMQRVLSLDTGMPHNMGYIGQIAVDIRKVICLPHLETFLLFIC